MAFLPALISAAPAILSGIDKALDVMDKFSPTVNRVSSMLFKGHSKSPSNLLDKIQTGKGRKELVTEAVKYVRKGKAKKKMRKLTKIIDKGGEDMGIDTRKYTKRANKAMKKLTRTTRSYHNVLERL